MSSGTLVTDTMITATLSRGVVLFGDYFVQSMYKMEVCPLGVSLIEGSTVLSLESKCVKRVIAFQIPEITRLDR